MDLIRVLSGGQDGADLAGWKAARLLSMPTSGTMPRDFMTESGPKPEYASLYNAVAHQSPDYSVRTRLNVRDSDATLIFRSTRAATHKGCDLTKRACGEFGKPALVIPAWAPVVPSPVKVAGMIRAAGFQVLNCAGSRGSADPAVAGVVGSGIEEWTLTYCICVFEILKGD